MSYHRHGHTFISKVLHYAEYLPYHLRVKGGSRLVKKHHFGLERQRTYNGNTLLLSAGKLSGEGVCLVCQVHQLQQSQRLFLRFFLRHQL